ncbi:alkaline protease 1-like [Lingula anatina]|uniref:Alkaline protease 1-like n=1 Tax=Lingula anatina TaxID=7574 RepID=A0A1S3INR3_LINAN|nr:alkaline protease 1-like [Lingula anatina]|eukprot:XP_013399174.1 alkaline protease 1-like [Lingula anatina]
MVGILVFGMFAITIAYQSGEQVNNMVPRDAPEAPPRRKGDHEAIRKKLQDAGVLRVSEEQGLVPLIEYTDGSGISGQYITRLLPGAKYGPIRRIIKGAGRRQQVKFNRDKDFIILRNISKSNLDDLRQLNDVIDEIEQDVKLTLNMEYCKSYDLPESYFWGLDALDGDAYNYKYNIWGDGKGIDVYVADTGINPNHEDFTGRVTIGLPTSTSVDDDGHGTHVASIIGGTNSGVAKRANIISLKVCSYWGYCSVSNTLDGCHLSNILNGCLWVKQRVQSTGRLSVFNFSLSGPFSMSLHDAVNDLLATGIPAIVGAGNDYGDACNYSPGSTANALTVGALKYFFEKASFANDGPCVDLYAPGEDIEGADFLENNTYTTESGTSMAAPFVHLVVAALLQVLRDNGTISSPSAQVVNYTNEYIIQYAFRGKLTDVSEDHLTLSTPCLDI